ITITAITTKITTTNSITITAITTKITTTNSITITAITTKITTTNSITITAITTKITTTNSITITAITTKITTTNSITITAITTKITTTNIVIRTITNIIINTADSIVAFAVEGSKDRGGEIVCEVRAHDAAAMGRVRAMACEPFVVFPIEERERALDQLRYLTAVSASASVSSSSSSSNSSSNNIRRLGKETTYQEMYEKSNGPSPLHLGSCYCSPLSETSQPLASSRLFLILTSTGLHVVGKIRPVDVVFRVLKKESSRGTRASVNGFTAQSCLNFLEELYGADEVCSWLYQVAAQ
ncbi:hypothetical protein VYU27_010431, partial [Nannochloropsis oceanica]